MLKKQVFIINTTWVIWSYYQKYFKCHNINVAILLLLKVIILIIKELQDLASHVALNKSRLTHIRECLAQVRSDIANRLMEEG